MSDTKTLCAELLEALEWKISMLAYLWRGQPENSLSARGYAKNYRETLSRMLELGYEDGLSIEAELPERLMPEAYLKMRDQLMATGIAQSDKNASQHKETPITSKAPNGTGKQDPQKPKTESRKVAAKTNAMGVKLK